MYFSTPQKSKIIQYEKPDTDRNGSMAQKFGLNDNLGQR